MHIVVQYREKDHLLRPEYAAWKYGIKFPAISLFAEE